MKRDILFPSKLAVTDQEIDISVLTGSQKMFFLELFEDMVALYDRERPRTTLGIAGPTGSGKSVTVALLDNLAKQSALPFRLHTLGIDAFHYSNLYLESHFDESGRPLKDVKGRFDTYDVSKFVSTIKDFRLGKKMSLPRYSRIIHDPIEEDEFVREEHCMLLVEGLWLLFDKSGWDAVYPLLDRTIFIEAEADKVKAAVLRRHERGGRSPESAAHHFDLVDSANSELVLSTKYRAHKIIPPYYEVA